MSEEIETTPANTGFFPMLANVIASPLKAFKALSEHPSRSWLILALLAMIVSVLPTVVSGPMLIERSRTAIEASLQSQTNGAEVTEQQREMALSFAANPLFVVALPSVGTVIGLLLGWLIWSGALYLVCTVMGGNTHFKQMWRLMVWSWLPFVLRGLLQTGYILYTGQLLGQSGFSGFVATTPGEPLSLNTQLLIAFLGQLDIFVVWNLILLVIGVYVTARISTVKAVIIPLVVWIIFMAASLGLTLGLSTMTQGMGG